MRKFKKFLNCRKSRPVRKPVASHTVVSKRKSKRKRVSFSKFLYRGK